MSGKSEEITNTASKKKNRKKKFLLFSLHPRALSRPATFIPENLSFRTLVIRIEFFYFSHLLVDPLGHRRRVLREALGEPQGDLALGRLDRVGAVDDVAADAVFFFFEFFRVFFSGFFVE